ncbi:uncharacterized protein BO97DRAFT_393535 [Aspergillus homomorphus CBS 101889]|uniref:Uncharacterized protein n=1 Tax=Aspergillus homomorphus (strain CBS 101889) TaxID=1450537 RepID=A0A395HTG0_ASPHC|nr:hypothetical protein BO97DRAFT_393535 [Aspergillus homomorphus CBS 101889]RAL10665.1 hypothetical protein BO97DRAFT_393535 [Aspergillus homomorphus CBS 101889]
MHLRSLLATSIWLVGSLASPVPETGDALHEQLSDRPTPRHSFPTVTGHEIRLPCLPPHLDDNSQLPDNETSTAFLSVHLRTEANALLVNNVSVFPAGYPMQLPAQKHHATEDGDDIETMQLTYGVDIEYLPPKVDSQVSDLYFVEVRFYDATGRPATSNVVHVRLSRDSAEDDLTISQIIVETFPDYHASHGHGNKVWHAQYWKMLANKYKTWSKEQRKGHRKNSEAQPMADALCGEKPSTGPHSKGKSPFELTGPSINYYAHHHHRPNPNFWRLIVPAMVPALLGILAGLVVCTTGVVVWKIVACALARCRGKRTKRCARGAGCCRGSGTGLSEKQQLMARELGAAVDV